MIIYVKHPLNQPSVNDTAVSVGDIYTPVIIRQDPSDELHRI